jgi:hypothetical protein
MQKYYHQFKEIDSVYWTDYFLNEFIPKYKFLERRIDADSRYIIYDRKEFYTESKILKLSLLLTKSLKFPPIQYFTIFRHVTDQPIHSDGGAVPRNVSFNLPLAGYEGTVMNFYNKKNSNIEPIVTDANYYNLTDLNLVCEFTGNNEWALVNSAVPHNIVNVNPDNPRYTVCLRFFGNPTFDDLVTINQS